MENRVLPTPSDLLQIHLQGDGLRRGENYSIMGPDLHHTEFPSVATPLSREKAFAILRRQYVDPLSQIGVSYIERDGFTRSGEIERDVFRVFVPTGRERSAWSIELRRTEREEVPGEEGEFAITPIKFGTVNILEGGHIVPHTVYLRRVIPGH